MPRPTYFAKSGDFAKSMGTRKEMAGIVDCQTAYLNNCPVYDCQGFAEWVVVFLGSVVVR